MHGQVCLEVTDFWVRDSLGIELKSNMNFYWIGKSNEPQRGKTMQYFKLTKAMGDIWGYL